MPSGEESFRWSFCCLSIWGNLQHRVSPRSNINKNKSEVKCSVTRALQSELWHNLQTCFVLAGAYSHALVTKNHHSQLQEHARLSGSSYSPGCTRHALCRPEVNLLIRVCQEKKSAKDWSLHYFCVSTAGIYIFFMKKHLIKLPKQERSCRLETWHLRGSRPRSVSSAAAGYKLPLFIHRVTHPVKSWHLSAPDCLTFALRRKPASSWCYRGCEGRTMASVGYVRPLKYKWSHSEVKRTKKRKNVQIELILP